MEAHMNSLSLCAYYETALFHMGDIGVDPVLSDPGEGEVMAINKTITEKIAGIVNKRIEKLLERAGVGFLEYRAKDFDSPEPIAESDISRHGPPRGPTALDISGYNPSGKIKEISREELARVVKTTGGRVPPAGTPGIATGRPPAMPTYIGTGTHPPVTGLPPLPGSGSIAWIDDTAEPLIPKADNAFCLSVGPDLDLDFRDFAMFDHRDLDKMDMDLGLFIQIAGIAVAEDTQHIYCPVTGLKYPFSKMIARYV